jgi:MFS family permease
MKTTTIKEKLWSRDFIIIMLACSGISFCNYFFAPTLPIYARDLTGTTVYAGLMMTAYTLAASVMRPIAGVLADRFGRVRVLIAGAALCTLACFLYSRTGAIAVLLAVRVLHGFGFGMHSTSGGAVAADVVPKSRLGEGLGIFGLYGTIAQALAPGIALGIIGTGAAGFRVLFYLAAGVSAVCLVLDTLIRYERRRKQTVPAADALPVPEKVTPADQPLPKTFLGFEAGVVKPSIVSLFVFLGLSGITTLLTLYAQEKGFGSIGWFFTVSAAGMFLSRALLGRVSDRRGPDAVVIPSLLALVIGLALIPFVGSQALLIALAAPLGLAQGAICPAVQTMMILRCSPQRRGTASAAYFLSIDLGLGAGAVLLGLIADRFGYAAVFWAGAVCAVLASAFYLLFLTGRKKEKA